MLMYYVNWIINMYDWFANVVEVLITYLNMYFNVAQTNIFHTQDSVVSSHREAKYFNNFVKCFVNNF